MNRKSSSSRTVIGRGARAGLVLAVAVAGASAAVLPASASPAAPHGITISQFFFTSGYASLSGGGHKWNVIVDTGGGGGSASAAISLAINTAHLGGLEEHSWGAPLPSSDVTVSSSGVMTVDSGTGLGSIGSADLTFTPTSHKTESANCASGSEFVYTGKMSGTMTLNTGLKGLKLAGHVTFASPNTLTFLDSCQLAPCAWSAWDSSTNGSGAFANGMTFAYPGKRVVSDLEITNVKTLSVTKDTFRIDSFIVQNAPIPKFSKSAKSLSVTAGKAGLITGAATLAHGKPGSYLSPGQKNCKFNGQNYSVSGTQYSKASYDASKPFEAHSILNGVIKIKPAGKCDFEIVTLKKK
jgi:hypothetical protein